MRWLLQVMLATAMAHEAARQTRLELVERVAVEQLTLGELRETLLLG